MRSTGRSARSRTPMLRSRRAARRWRPPPTPPPLLLTSTLCSPPPPSSTRSQFASRGPPNPQQLRMLQQVHEMQAKEARAHIRQVRVRRARARPPHRPPPPQRARSCAFAHPFSRLPSSHHRSTPLAPRLASQKKQALLKGGTPGRAATEEAPPTRRPRDPC